jgi:RNase H-fold protein (predicted Holliday junction resolvase)
MTLNNQNILSIDYGERYVGFALKKSNTNIGTALEILESYIKKNE